MTLFTLVSSVLPVLFKLVTWAWDRMVNHPISTLQGTALGAIALAFMQGMHCDLTLMNQGLLAALPLIKGAIGTDHNKTGASLWSYISQAIPSDGGKEGQVSTDNLGMLPLLFLSSALLLSACSYFKTHTAIQIQGDVQRVVITGCQDWPAIEVALAAVQEFLPPGTTTAEINAGITIAEKVTDGICAKALAHPSAVIPVTVPAS
jgi:hypothetical protein